MFKKFHYNLFWIPAVLVSILILISLASYCYSQKDINLFSSNHPQSWNENWKLENGTAISLPCQISGSSGEPTTITKRITAEADGQYLLIRASMQFLTFSIDGKTIYSHDLPEIGYIGKTPGSAWCMVYIPKGTAGELLSITASSPYEAYVGRFNSVLIGLKGDLISSIRNENFMNALVPLTLLALGLFLILFAFVFYIIRHKVPEFLYLSLFSIFSSFWLLGESKMMQFYVHNPFWIANLSYVGLLIFPIFLVLFLDQLSEAKGRRILRPAVLLLSANALITCVLVALRLYDFYELLWSTLTCVVITLVLFVIFVIQEIFRYHNSSMKRLFFTSCILFAACLLELISFTMGNITSISRYYKVGILVFFLVIVSQTFIRKQESWETEKKAEYFEKIVFYDGLTGIHNRNAYRTLVEQNYNNLSRPLRLVLFDLNDLKIINDCYGHQSGDESLIFCSRCMEEAFSRIGKCFRIGGDEFACVIENDKEEAFQKALEVFHKKEAAFAEIAAYPFSIAHGDTCIDENDPISFRQLSAETDQRLYQNKRLHKSKKNNPGQGSSPS